METCIENWKFLIRALFQRKKLKILLGKKLISFYTLAQNIHCGHSLEPPHRGGSNKYPQCMFWIINKKITGRYTPANPSFFFLYKSGVQGGYSFHGHVFLMLIEAPPIGDLRNKWAACASRQ